MLLSARIWNSDNSEFWLAECSALSVMTQGVSQEDARFMLDDAIRMLLPDLEFSAVWLNQDAGTLAIEVPDAMQAFSAIVERNRRHGERAYAEAAEKVKRNASIETLDEFLSAFGKRLTFSVEEIV